MRQLGTHLLLEMSGCCTEFLNNTERIQSALLQAATDANATVLGSSFHKFSPQGVSGVVVIAESHISIHTWPEFGYAAVDVFTCGDRAMPHNAAASLVKAFAPSLHEVREIARGIPGQAGDRPGQRQPAWRPPVDRGWA